MFEFWILTTSWFYGFLYYILVTTRGVPQFIPVFMWSSQGEKGWGIATLLDDRKLYDRKHFLYKSVYIT